MQINEIYSSYHYSIFVENDIYYKSPKTEYALERLKASVPIIEKVNNPNLDTPKLVDDEFVGLYIPKSFKEIRNEDFKNFILELCSIIKYLHSLDIYALDLKPDHIRNNKNKIYLIDWYEKSLGAQWGDPYRLFNNGEPSKTEDVYCIGNLIYFYLIGEHPFHSTNPMQSLYNIRKKTPPLTYTEYDEVIQKCLNKSPMKRYQDIDEVIKIINLL